jgi:hypothetical protein
VGFGANVVKREPGKSASSLWRAKNPGKATEQSRRGYLARKARNPEGDRDLELKRDFGISMEEYKVMHSKQGGVCAICKEPEKVIYKGTLRSLSVDHCHQTGKVRGLLCTKCNRGLGLLQDSLDLLKKSVAYLEDYDRMEFAK